MTLKYFFRYHNALSTEFTKTLTLSMDTITDQLAIIALLILIRIVFKGIFQVSHVIFMKGHCNPIRILINSPVFLMLNLHDFNRRLKNHNGFQHINTQGIVEETTQVIKVSFCQVKGNLSISSSVLLHNFLSNNCFFN